MIWCPIGPLASLPLHAAGLYSEPKSKVYNFVVSSYAPDLSSLLPSSRNPNPFSGILGVAQALKNIGTTLPDGTDELDEITKHASHVQFTHLQGEQATTSNVLSAMQRHSLVHIACPVTYNATDPAASSFHLNDGELSLATIVQAPLAQPDFAFLSVAQSETDGWALSEGPIKLAAGMMLAGYSNVVVKTQFGQDRYTAQVAGHIYAQLLKEEDTGEKDASRALHSALAQLRDEIGERAFGLWVPYLHVGK